MDALQPTFMLPPNFRFPPGGKIKPGLVLEEGDNGLPNPQEELLNGEALVTGLETLDLPHFHHSSDAKSNNKLGLWADTFSLAEIGLGGERGHDYNLVVDTGPAKISTFSSNRAWVSKLMEDPFLAEYTKRPRRRAVYLITGIMVAESATIEIQKGARSAYQAKVVVSGEGFGLPVKAGPEFEREASNNGSHTLEMTKPFILAYAVKRIQKKVLGGFTSKDDNRRALWNDEKASVADDEWDIEQLTQETMEGSHRKVQ